MTILAKHKRTNYNLLQMRFVGAKCHDHRCPIFVSPDTSRPRRSYGAGWSVTGHRLRSSGALRAADVQRVNMAEPSSITGQSCHRLVPSLYTQQLVTQLLAADREQICTVKSCNQLHCLQWLGYRSVYCRDALSDGEDSVFIKHSMLGSTG